MAIKLTQNQFYGDEIEKPISSIPGTLFIATDTNKMFLYNELGLPVLVTSQGDFGVPYTGAVTDLDMGANTVIAQNVQLSGGTLEEGKLTWNPIDGTLDLGLLGGNATLQIGQESFYHVKAAEAISNGDVVYASGTNGASGSIVVSKFLADGNIKAFLILGVATEDIAINNLGYVTAFGKVRGINTSAFTEGDVLYPSPTVAGALTNVQPISPDVEMPIAFAVNSKSNGTILVRLTPPNELAELHDVHFTAPIETKQIIVYSEAEGHWNNETISSLFNAGANITVAEHADNAAAIVAGLVAGDLYRTVDVLKIVH